MCSVNSASVSKPSFTPGRYRQTAERTSGDSPAPHSCSYSAGAWDASIGASVTYRPSIGWRSGHRAGRGSTGGPTEPPEDMAHAGDDEAVVLLLVSWRLAWMFWSGL